MLTVVFHVCVFVLIVKALVLKVHSERNARNLAHFFAAIALTRSARRAARSKRRVAILYVQLGALSDVSSSMLYSLSAITSYGHSNIFLEQRWRLLEHRGDERANPVWPDDRVPVRAIEEVRPFDGVDSSPRFGGVTNHSSVFCPSPRRRSIIAMVGRLTCVPGCLFSGAV